MKKVNFFISKVNSDYQQKGVGYIVDNDLLVPSISSKNNPYIRVFEDVVSKCHKVMNEENQFRGYITIAYENINVFNKEKNGYDTLDYVETTYYIWYKLID